MRVEKIIEELSFTHVASAAHGVDVKGLAYDSRQVKPGYMFVAIPGRRQDGMTFIDDALQRGAVAVVGEETVALRHVPYVRVPDARRALADAACTFYGNPSADLTLFGVTGTNGKTTTTFMLRSLLTSAGSRPGLISTVHYEIGQRVIPANRTTPEAPDLQAMLQQMQRVGCRQVVMEVSSHALDQQRVRGIDFDVAIYTNLTRDHLDYHGSMENYFEAKRNLFRSLGHGGKKATAVINLDETWGRKLVEDVVGGPADCVTYGTQPGADVVAEDIVLNRAGSLCTVRTPWGSVSLQLTQLGRFNIHNALAALTACASRGMPLDTAAQALEKIEGVPGRLECVAPDHPFNVFVDYAHTDDALNNVLQILREITPGRIWVVFGCGGDRDRSKRPAMGAVAEAWGDHTWITADNPRSEDPAAIAGEIAGGFGDPAGYTVILDRAEAIQAAIQRAGAGDAVLIAGKGHENFQEFGNTVIPFDDVEVARAALGIQRERSEP